MSTALGEEYLENVESLSLQSMVERRVAYLNILDFGTVVLHEVRKSYFEDLNMTKPHDPSKITQNWDTITSAIERVIDVEAPPKYDKFCGVLGQRRNDIVHDVTEGIPEGPLNGLVETAPDWREWLITQGQKYYETIEELGAEERLVTQLQQDLQSISSANIQSYVSDEEELADLQYEAQELQQRLSDIDPDTVTVNPDLADLILKINTLEREFESIESNQTIQQEFGTWEPISEKIRKNSGENVEVEFEEGGSMELDLGQVSQDHTKPLDTRVTPQDDSQFPHRLRNTEPFTPVYLEMIDPRDGGSEIVGEIKSVTIL
ncbi:hypothetical protein [Halobaculum rubrum]|uniref:hypothetical protein n=1 Tax=Halobaculum rubrum TaxID=2872158 RepID=UPI001CA3CE66|nr:hypothetical protein [Halobaculum rubrum]QZX99818.1 hypothetical protein K6T25_01530 [Halobaculum rubrum]QZX99855.1 hypothetical protein K6T25_01725 [Halobaculum rubrum]